MKTIIIMIAMLCNFLAPSVAMQSQLYAKSLVCVDVSQDIATFCKVCAFINSLT